MRYGLLSISTRWITFAGMIFVNWSAAAPLAQDSVRSVDARDAEGSSAAVVVPDVPLVHTRQYLPFDDFRPSSEKAVRAREQIDAVLAQLKPKDPAAGEQIVKLNVVGASDEVVAEVKQALAEKFRAATLKPAVTYVVGKLRDPRALVGIDAVLTGGSSSSKSVSLSVGKFDDRAVRATLPAGPKVYVSG